MDGYIIGHFLSKLRKQKGLKQKEVAEAIQVSDKAVSRWETGKGIPDVDSLQRLSDFYEVSINEILAGRYLREDEIKEISDCNLRQMGKKASNLKKRLLLAVTAIIGLFILLIGIFAHSAAAGGSTKELTEGEIKNKFVYLTSGSTTEETSAGLTVIGTTAIEDSGADFSTERIFMGLAISTTVFEYSISDMDAFFLDVAALEESDIRYNITVDPDHKLINMYVIRYEYSGTLEDFELHSGDMKELPIL